jgi:hydrogenase/urease accessory protein HupE
MWGVEHTSMLIAFGILAAWLAYNRKWFWLSVAFMTQLPFWAGAHMLFTSGDASPSNLNIILNVTLSGILISFAEKLQEQGRGAMALTWLCILFLGLTSVDVWHLVAPFESYFLVQEAGHYLALLIIGGRAYVNRRAHGIVRNSMYPRGSGQGGGLV